MNTSISELLNKRFQWEKIVSFRKTYDLPSYDGNIDNLKYFIEHGSVNNRFRKNFDQAMELAIEIVNEYTNTMERNDRSRRYDVGAEYSL